MSIAKRLIAELKDRASEHRIADVRLGLGYVAVRLDDGAAGAAFTFRDQLGDGCCVFRGLRPLAGRSAADLLAGLGSDQPLEAAVGLATANALANRMGPDFFKGDVIEALDLGPEVRVGMIGYFGPLVAPLRQRVGELLIFEKAERSADGPLYPAESAPDMLPGCQVALITATALINRTLDDLLQAARDCRQVVLLGASTPLCPRAFAGTPVTLLSGIVIDRAEDLLQVVSEGGGMRDFRGLVSKVNLRT
ncbi:MAG: DUF364 domain-containing protein [Proteobacteria bacterium]|nr:DUF364 domain-containing protein [Pseudomonadota bacterium]